MNTTEHPFSQYVRLLGKGKTGSRSLSFDEAQNAMSMILRSEVEDVQLGAFLMLLRVKEESPEEIAGFVSACREFIHQEFKHDLDMPPIDIDWSSYAGKRKQPPWYILSIALLIENGFTILMHGAKGHTAGRLYSEDVLRFLGAPIANTAQEIAESLGTQNFAFLPLKHLCAPLDELISLRPLFGLRSPVHTLCRLLNPYNARLSLQSVFHPAYLNTHHQAAVILGEQNTAVFKGDSGEIEYRPHGRIDIRAISEGVEKSYSIPRCASSPNTVEISVNSLLRCWTDHQLVYISALKNQGSETEINRPDGVLEVIGTAAITLLQLNKVDTFEAGLARATEYWNNRNQQQIFNYST